MIPQKLSYSMQASPPRGAGVRPQRSGLARFLAGAGATALLGVVVAACAQGNASTQAPVVLGLTSTAPAYYSDAEITLYEAQKPVPLPILKPSAAQESVLGAQKPYPHMPWLKASDISVEVHYTLSNLDAQDQTVELLIDPWNEFVRWSPGVTVVNNEDTEPNLSGYDNYFVVPAKGRIEGDLSPDDMLNMETNLATVENVLATPPANLSVSLTTFCNHVFDIQHRSNDGDPLVTPYIPTVIAGLTGFDLGIRTASPANVAVEITVDLIDQNGNRVQPPGSNLAVIGTPATVLAPPGAKQGN
jgi:hypothetical protein